MKKKTRRASRNFKLGQQTNCQRKGRPGRAATERALTLSFRTWFAGPVGSSQWDRMHGSLHECRGCPWSNWAWADTLDHCLSRPPPLHAYTCIKVTKGTRRAAAGASGGGRRVSTPWHWLGACSLSALLPLVASRSLQRNNPGLPLADTVGRPTLFAFNLSVSCSSFEKGKGANPSQVYS
jgi:hypothetical protein